LNAIAMAQLVPAASVRPEQPSPVTVKSSVLGTAALLMNSGPLPLLATVIDCAALLVPVSCGPKVSDDGVSVTAGADAGGGGGGGGGGAGGGGGGGVDVEQPASAADADVAPSLTVTRQVDEL
jgi:hypothetical protein